MLSGHFIFMVHMSITLRSRTLLQKQGKLIYIQAFFLSAILSYNAHEL